MIEATDLFIHQAVEDEDEHSLEAVEDCEEIRHDDRLSVYVEETERPRWTQQHNQNYCTFNP